MTCQLMSNTLGQTDVAYGKEVTVCVAASPKAVCAGPRQGDGGWWERLRPAGARTPGMSGGAAGSCARRAPVLEACARSSTALFAEHPARRGAFLAEDGVVAAHRAAGGAQCHKVGALSEFNLDHHESTATP